MSYTIPEYVDTKEQAVLAIASTIADEDKSALGDGSVNRALDVLADTLAGENVEVPQTNAGAILALAQYVGGGGGGASYDAVIRLTHAENSGPDDYTNLTPSIVEGTFASLMAKLQGGGYPCILVQYYHPWGERWAVPMVHGLSGDASTLHMTIAGYLPFSMNSVVLNLNWSFNDTVAWAD